MKPNRLNPQSREEAFAWQLVDSAKKALAMALVGPKEFGRALRELEDFIEIYRRGPGTKAGRSRTK